MANNRESYRGIKVRSQADHDALDEVHSACLDEEDRLHNLGWAGRSRRGDLTMWGVLARQNLCRKIENERCNIDEQQRLWEHDRGAERLWLVSSAWYEVQSTLEREVCRTLRCMHSREESSPNAAQTVRADYLRTLKAWITARNCERAPEAR